MKRRSSACHNRTAKYQDCELVAFKAITLCCRAEHGGRDIACRLGARLALLLLGISTLRCVNGQEQFQRSHLPASHIAAEKKNKVPKKERDRPGRRPKTGAPARERIGSTKQSGSAVVAAAAASAS